MVGLFVTLLNIFKIIPKAKNFNRRIGLWSLWVIVLVW